RALHGPHFGSENRRRTLRPRYCDSDSSPPPTRGNLKSGAAAPAGRPSRSNWLLFSDSCRPSSAAAPGPARRPDWTRSSSASSRARIRPFWASSWYASHPVKAADAATTPQRIITTIQWLGSGAPRTPDGLGTPGRPIDFPAEEYIAHVTFQSRRLKWTTRGFRPTECWRPTVRPRGYSCRRW